MAQTYLLLASILVLALLGVANSADHYRAGRSLKPYLPDDDEDDEGGRSLKQFQPHESHPSYMGGHSLKRNTPEEDDCAIKIQGIIYCKEDGKLIPMKGANARVTCMVKDKKLGYETTPLSVETSLTDKKGYFLINLGKYISPRYSLNNCRVFLEDAAPGNCRFPTNINYGRYGAPLLESKSRRLSDSSTLYSVGPFAFKPLIDY